MSIRYHHTQRGTLMLIVLPLAALCTAAAGFIIPTTPQRATMWALTGMFILLTWLFSSLTVDVNERTCNWYFGPGVWRYGIALADIGDVQVVRNRWWHGFGIRRRLGFRLYNVSGLQAVELRLKSGDVRRIGTDDAQGLATALKI